MVVHPGHGNHSGTMVNAILHHCNLPPIPLDPSLKASMEDAAGDKLVTALSVTPYQHYH